MAEFVNVVKIQKQNMKEVYNLDEYDEIKIGSSDLASIILPGIAPLHLVVELKDNRHFIVEIHKNIFINAVLIKTTGKCNIELKHKDLLILGEKFSGKVLIYKNEDANSRFQYQTFHDAAERFGFSIPTKISKLGYEFFTKCPIGNLFFFGQYLINFLFQHFSVDRAVLYHVRENGTKWKGVFARAGETFFKPSKTLMRQLRKEMKAISFDVSDGDASVSIVQQHVSNAFVFPVIYKGKLIAALYLDTLAQNNKKLNADDFIIISSLMPGVSACMRNIGYAEDELKKNRIYAEKIFNSLLVEQDNFYFSNLISDNSLAYYNTSGTNKYFSFSSFKGEMTSRYTIGIYLKYIQEAWEIDQEDFACKELKDLLYELPEKFSESEIEIAYLSIGQKGKLSIAHMGNISIFLIPGHGNIKKITIPGEIGEIVQESIDYIKKGDLLLFAPSKVDCSIFLKKIKECNQNIREEKLVKQLVKENINTYALFII